MRAIRHASVRGFHLAFLVLALWLCVPLGALPGAAPAQAGGALAVGDCGAFGQGVDFSTIQEASVAAVRKCKGDCQVVATVRRGCIAYAIDATNLCGPFGYAARPTLHHAQNTALRYCHRYGGRDCVIRTWVCDRKG